MLTSKRLYVNVDVLQRLSSSVQGSEIYLQKTFPYGGVTRAWIPADCWKIGTREMFKDIFHETSLEVVIKRAENMVAEEIKKLGNINNPQTQAQRVLEAAGFKNNEIKIKENLRNVTASDTSLIEQLPIPKSFFFLSVAQARKLAKIAIEDPEALKENPSEKIQSEAQKAIDMNPGIDTALFGGTRNAPHDSSVQITHAFSTHRFMYGDDDLDDIGDSVSTKKADGSKNVHFSRYIFYRNANVNVYDLIGYLGDDTVEAVCAFVRAFVQSSPKGRKNTFPNCEPPDTVMVTLRTDSPKFLASAFETPITGVSDYAIESTQALIRYTHIIGEWSEEPRLILLTSNCLPDKDKKMTFDMVLNRLRLALNGYLKKGVDA